MMTLAVNKDQVARPHLAVVIDKVNDESLPHSRVPRVVIAFQIRGKRGVACAEFRKSVMNPGSFPAQMVVMRYEVDRGSSRERYRLHFGIGCPEVEI